MGYYQNWCPDDGGSLVVMRRRGMFCGRVSLLIMKGGRDVWVYLWGSILVKRSLVVPLSCLLDCQQ